MYWVTGWFELVSSRDPDAAGDEESAIIEELRQRCGAFEGTNIEVRWPQLNYAYFLTVTGNANHLRTHNADVHELLRLVRERLPASWGLLYERDDERREAPGPDSYRVTVMTPGEGLRERVDPFFSPYVPLLEGPEWTPAAEDLAEYYDAVCLPVEFREIDLGRSEVLGIEWRGSTVELTVDFVLAAGHPEYGVEPRRGVVRWGGVSEVHWSGRVGGVLESVAEADGLYRVQAAAGVLTVKADTMRVDF